MIHALGAQTDGHVIVHVVGQIDGLQAGNDAAHILGIVDHVLGIAALHGLIEAAALIAFGVDGGQNGKLGLVAGGVVHVQGAHIVGLGQMVEDAHTVSGDLSVPAGLVVEQGFGIDQALGIEFREPLQGVPHVGGHGGIGQFAVVEIPSGIALEHGDAVLVEQEVHPAGFLAAAGGDFISDAVAVGVAGLEGAQHFHQFVLGGGHFQAQLVQPVLTDHGAMALIVKDLGHVPDAVLAGGVALADDVPHILAHHFPAMGRVFLQVVGQIQDGAVVDQLVLHAVDHHVHVGGVARRDAQIELLGVGGAAVPLDVGHDDAKAQDILIEVVHDAVLFGGQIAGVVALELNVFRQHIILGQSLGRGGKAGGKQHCDQHCGHDAGKRFLHGEASFYYFQYLDDT